MNTSPARAARWTSGPTAQVLIASAAAVPFAFAFPRLAVRLETLSDLFVRALTLIVIPLIATLLITAFVQLVGRRSSRVVYWLFAILIFGTLFSVGLGLLLAAVFEPGLALRPSTEPGAVPPPMPNQSFAERLVPNNLFAAFAGGDLLHIFVISALFAVGIVAGGETGKRWLSWLSDTRDICLAVTSLLARLAPLIAFSALSAAIPTLGADLLAAFGRLLFATGIGLSVIAALALLGPALVVRAQPSRWLAAAAPGLSIAFSAASSAAAMPALVAGMTRSGASPERVGLVLGTSSLNQLGSTFYVSLAAAAVVQAAGFDLGAADWVNLLALAYITTKVAPPVPRASLVLIAALVAGYGVPPHVSAPLIGLLITADVVFDMTRTLVNNIGHVGVCMLLDRVGNPREDEP